METISQQCPGLMLPVRAIRLSQGRHVIVDPEDYPSVAGYWWQVQQRRAGKVYIRAVMRDLPGQPWRQMHTLLTGWKQTQHINGNPFDCRRSNLRELNPSTLQASRRKVPEFGGAPTASRFKGVIWDDRRGLWRAQLKGGLGWFDTDEEAARAYDRRAAEVWGEYAVTNEVLGLYETAPDPRS